MEAVMREPGARRWSYTLALAAGIRVARSIAAPAWNPRAEERVRTFVERWDARAAREADHLGLMP
jgi:hypothetical protein